MRFIIFLIPFVFMLVSCNPFAPGLGDSSDGNSTLLGDQTTIDGVFQNIKNAYTMGDTTIYGPLINSNFTFQYYDYDAGTSPTWGRDEEMRITHGLFQNVLKLTLVWNQIQSSSIDSSNTIAQIKRGFNLKVTFNANDIADVSGYATLQMERPNAQAVWTIVRWNDESNF